MSGEWWVKYGMEHNCCMWLHGVAVFVRGRGKLNNEMNGKGGGTMLKMAGKCCTIKLPEGLLGREAAEETARQGSVWQTEQTKALSQSMAAERLRDSLGRAVQKWSLL